MLTQLLTLVAVATSLVIGKPFPNTPDGVQKPGEKCVVEWSVDTTGTWKTAYVELMAGSNLAMQHITTLGTIDATDPKNTSFTYDCLAVTPPSAIYFYQFTSPFAPIADTTWTTRWPISNGDGTTVPPEHDSQPNGDKIPWGNGQLVNPSLAVAAPTDAGSQVAGATGASGSSSASASGVVSGPSAPLSSASETSSTSQSSGSSTAVTPSSTVASVSSKMTSAKPSQVLSASGVAASSAAGNTTNAAITMSRASTPLFALGAVAAFAVVAL